MEASTLTHAETGGLFARPSPLLGLQGDDRLVAATRDGNAAAFEALVSRYQPRLLGFCRQMLRSTEDAEDVLQEVFVAAYNAMLADDRTIAVRPWLYRIARNRCLNHLRKPVSDGVDTMDVLPFENGTTTHDRAQTREEFRNLLNDVGELPETQRTALLLREIDAMSYDEIAVAMDTTVPGVKSLLVRARIALAESTQARELTCDDVKLELAEVAEGLTKITGPVRRHVRSCESCKDFRGQLRSNSKALAALFPIPMLAMLKGTILAKLGFSSGASASSASAGAGSAAVASGGVASGAAAAGAGGGIGAVGAALGTKAAVGVVSAVLLTAGAVEVKKATMVDHSQAPGTASKKVTPPARPDAAPAEATAAPGETVVTPVPVNPPTTEAPAPAPAVDGTGLASGNGEGAGASASSDQPGAGNTVGFPPDSGGTIGGGTPPAGSGLDGDTSGPPADPPAA